MIQIRHYRPEDRAAVAHVCVVTGYKGNDATGIYQSDALVPDIFALPYVDLAPDFAFVAVHGDDVVGYILGVPDTVAFVDVYEREWLPTFASRYPRPDRDVDDDDLSDDELMVLLGHHPERMLIPELDEYPAHLHIDLLPRAQGQGVGRRLMATLCAALADAGVPGVNLSVDAANANGRAFYARLGFHELPSSTSRAPRLAIGTAVGASLADA